MRERFRLNLEAPFTRATHDFLNLTTGIEADPGFQRPANDLADRSAPLANAGQASAQHPRRPPVTQRNAADLRDEAMARYIGGLEARTIAHFRKHAPRWLRHETDKILLRWSAPQPKPAPRWAPAIDRRSEARDYAAALLRERLRARMHRIGEIRIVRTLGGYGQVDPLALIFHDRSTVFREAKPHRTNRMRQ